MNLKQYNDPVLHEKFRSQYDRTENILVGPEITEACVATMVSMKKGFETVTHAHKSEEQIFIVLEGTGLLTLEEENNEIKKGHSVYIPRNANHKILATSEELIYIYISVWPKGKQKELKSKVYEEKRILNIKYE